MILYESYLYPSKDNCSRKKTFIKSLHTWSEEFHFLRNVNSTGPRKFCGTYSRDQPEDDETHVRQLTVMTLQFNFCSIIDIQTSSKLIKINYILKCISLQAKNLNYMVLYMDNEILAWIMDIKINIENYSYILLINFWYKHPQKHWINTPIKICFIYIFS